LAPAEPSAVYLEGSSIREETLSREHSGPPGGINQLADVCQQDRVGGREIAHARTAQAGVRG
jgi:hypothetical protein